jgi:hypothetical protein
MGNKGAMRAPPVGWRSRRRRCLWFFRIRHLVSRAPRLTKMLFSKVFSIVDYIKGEEEEEEEEM